MDVSLKNISSTYAGWWFQPLKKNLKVSWDDEIPNMESQKSHVPEPPTSMLLSGIHLQFNFDPFGFFDTLDPLNRMGATPRD